jgi:hypothetical protein
VAIARLLTLAIGIGATAAVFGVVRAVILEPRSHRGREMKTGSNRPRLLYRPNDRLQNVSTTAAEPRGLVETVVDEIEWLTTCD